MKRKTFILACALFMMALKSPLCFSQAIITTLAGNGTFGYAGDGGSATTAEFSGPAGVATDNNGNVYVADIYSSRIRKINAAGIITTFAGNGSVGYAGDGGLATNATLNYPNSIAADRSGDVYIADPVNAVIRKANNLGIITTFAGNGISGYGGDGGLATGASLSGSARMAVDDSGNVYLADRNNNRIRKVDNSGVINTVAGDGTAGFSGDGGAATNAKIDLPSGVAVDRTGNIFIVDNGNHRIRKVTSAGVITTIAGNGTIGFSGDGGMATDAQLGGISTIAVDKVDNIYIVDSNRVRKINSAGIISTVVGTGLAGYSGDGGAATAAEINSPGGIAVDSNGVLFIGDTPNGRVRKITHLVTTSVSNAPSLSCFAYPNPNNGRFTIWCGNIQHDNSIKIYNLTGKLVYVSPLVGATNDIDISKEPSGIYLLDIRQQEKDNLVQKIILNH